MRNRDFWRFYGRVLLRVPGVFTNAAGIFGSLIFIAAAVALFVKGKALANDILGLHGFSPWWGIVPIVLIATHGLASAIYAEAQEAQAAATATNRVIEPPSPTQLIFEAGSKPTVIVGGPNAVLPGSPGPPPPPGTGTEAESGQ
jgi:hypothetical protein